MDLGKYCKINFNTYNFLCFLFSNHKLLNVDTMNVIRLVKRRNPTRIIGHHDESSPQLLLFAIDL